MFTFIASVATAARLENAYLPPGSAGTSGGFINAPFGGGQLPSSGRFGAVATSGFSAGAPSRSFGPSGQPIAILRFNNENYGDGNYRFE